MGTIFLVMMPLRRKKRLPSGGGGDISQRHEVPPLSSKVLDLADLAEKHALNVPFRIRVVNGFMAADNMKDPTFVVDEIYSVHLIKETEVLKSRAIGNSEYYIPLNSAATFGLIQDENNEGRVFDNVEELVSCSPQPKIVAVLNEYTDANGIHIVRENDVLAIKDVTAGMRKSVISLKAYNISMQKEVVLHLDMKIEFIANPSAIQLYLTELMDHVDFPSSCTIFSSNSSLSETLTLSKVTLLQRETQRSVLVSLFCSNPTSKRKKATSYIEIPTRININVSIIDTDEEDPVYQQLMEESRDLLREYNPANIQYCMDSKNDNAYMTQARLLAEIRKEKEKRTLTQFAPHSYEYILIGEEKELTPRSDPKLVSSTIQHQSGAANTSTKPIKSSGVIKPAIPLPSKGSPITNKKPLLPPPRVIIRPRPSAYEELDINGLLPATTYELTTIVKTPENYVSGSSSPGIRKRNVADNKASVPLVAVAKTTGDTEDTHLSQQIKFIQEKMQEMEKQIGKFLKKQSHLEDEINVLKLSGRQQKGNQSPLVIHRGMSPTQILEVLDAAGLSQYKDAFARELVDGEIFAVLDEDTLANELRVTSRIHRMRLLKLFQEN